MKKPIEIIEVVYRYFDMDISFMHLKNRIGAIIKVKHIAMYFLCRYTPMTLDDIGLYFGYKLPGAHCVVINAKNSVNNQCSYNISYYEDIKRIDEILANMNNEIPKGGFFQENDFYTDEEMQRNICI